MRILRDLLIAGTIGVLVWFALQPRLGVGVPSLPTFPSLPAPAPSPKPPAPPPRNPFRPWSETAIEAVVGGRVGPDGKTEVACDLPNELHMKNTGGSDGAGLCVFTSIGHSARWQNVNLLKEFQAYMKKFPGGGYPSKVEKMIERIAKDKGLPVPRYIQVEGNDLDILRLACRTGRMPAVTYSVSPTGRYGGQRIAHMVSLVHADDNYFVILDNNYPGTDKYEWLNAKEFLRAYAPGWTVILLDPPPAPVPHN